MFPPGSPRTGAEIGGTKGVCQSGSQPLGPPIGKSNSAWVNVDRGHRAQIPALDHAERKNDGRGRKMVSTEGGPHLPKRSRSNRRAFISRNSPNRSDLAHLSYRRVPVPFGRPSKTQRPARTKSPGRMPPFRKAPSRRARHAVAAQATRCHIHVAARLFFLAGFETIEKTHRPSVLCPLLPIHRSPLPFPLHRHVDSSAEQA